MAEDLDTGLFNKNAAPVQTIRGGNHTHQLPQLTNPIKKLATSMPTPNGPVQSSQLDSFEMFEHLIFAGFAGI